MIETFWTIGQTYYAACGEMHGRSWDLGQYGEPVAWEQAAELAAV